MIDTDTLEGMAVNGTPAPPGPELIDRVPEPDIVRGWLADSVRRTDLLRSLLRLARRKASYAAQKGKDSARIPETAGASRAN